MTEFDLVSDPEIRRWKEHCHALPVGDGDLFFDHEQFSAFSLDLSADLSEKIDEGAGATRHARSLRGIPLVGSSRPDHHTDLSSRMQPYASARDFLLERSL